MPSPIKCLLRIVKIIRKGIRWVEGKGGINAFDTQEKTPSQAYCQRVAK
jgi:hypothetical protein